MMNFTERVENQEFSELVWRDGQVQVISLPRKISSSQESRASLSSFINMKRRFESLNVSVHDTKTHEHQQQQHLNMFMEVPNNLTDSQIVPVNEYANANMQGDSTKNDQGRKDNFSLFRKSSHKGNDATVPTTGHKSMEEPHPVASSSFCSNNPVYNNENLKRRCYGDSEASADHSDQNIEEDVIKQVCGSKRKRVAEVHNRSERKRRNKINQKMRALRELIPHCNKVDKASMLDEAIEYLKSLQLQVQIMSMGSGYCMPQMIGIMYQQIQAAQMAMSMRMQQMGPHPHHLMISPMAAAMAGFQPNRIQLPPHMSMFCTPPLGLLDQTVPVRGGSMPMQVMGSEANNPKTAQCSENQQHSK